ncbi:PEP-CTERM sorting domain-containing protein [Coleofasciculus sp. FACHB-SPT9]|uniref:PEP-CTERM sorting domain-containing protein n=1 Tax=Cyanophyceae TaxID=3028117 RepID=UPI0016853146|nr:PEP-CTERM sorting domain-containing protein [Coleofasciculus sp. FACHB-SPT9]MBD1890240.1 PEP-CTERM sorting domain-containing protein [Coleofasciculus sp. FACHB-SPT9]
MKNLSVVTAVAVFMALGMLGEVQQASAASIIQNKSTGTNQILFFSPLGQTFTAEDTFIKSIGFYIEDDNPSNAPVPDNTSLTVSLYKGIIGTFLGSGIVDNLAEGFQGYVDVDFSSIPLTVGETYTAIVETNSPFRYLEIDGLRDRYPGGSAILNGIPRDDIDTRFRVLVGETESVPEPASVLGLLAFGTLGAGSFLKRRRKQQQSVSSVASNV